MDGLSEFLSESLRMDRLPRGPLNYEIEAVEKFLKIELPKEADVLELATTFDRTARWKDRRVLKPLETILSASGYPNELHLRFVALAPLTSMNGIVGRLIWLSNWLQVRRDCPTSFLRTWYDSCVEMDRQARAAAAKKPVTRRGSKA